MLASYKNNSTRTIIIIIIISILVIGSRNHKRHHSIHPSILQCARALPWWSSKGLFEADVIPTRQADGPEGSPGLQRAARLEGETGSEDGELMGVDENSWGVMGWQIEI